MGTHTRRAFLNSCLKTPIDPCNNCPAPIYNRPKMYLGRLTTATPLSKATEITENTEPTNSLLWPQTGIRSLAKLYDSIPDYCDINHLTEEEFYSTLDSLRSTCRELKTKPCSLEESSNTSTLSLSTVCKTKKPCKKKNGSTKKGGSKKKSSKTDKKVVKDKLDSHCITSTPCSGLLEMPLLRNNPIYKKDFQDEVEAFKKTLKDYEVELKNRATSRCLGRAKSSSFLAKLDSPKIKVDENTQTEPECMLLKPTTPSLIGTSLRKSFSSNDIDSMSEVRKENIGPEDAISSKPVAMLIKAGKPALRDKTRLSNYFAEQPTKLLSPTTSELPKITVQSPSTDFTSSNTTTERSPTFIKKGKRGKKKHMDQIKVPFGVFALGNNSTKKENIETPSPVHPVARPNLAATLRAEVSKKKLKELQNNCTYYDTTPQIDWEVRKTPAWRLLSLNESHEEILALRLATRKAEQALQQREYELNMELMRQRVKSAPLLLEGSTFWGPTVGKLSHNCQNEGLKHTCDSLKRKQRKQSAVEQEQFHYNCRDKLSDLQKIYGSGGKASSQSRTSQRSAASTQRRRKEKKRSLPHLDTRPPTLPSCRSHQHGGNDSGDDLSSGDRAFL